MTAQNNVMKKLSGKLRVLKASGLFDRNHIKELNRRASKSGYGYGNQGQRSAIKDDYILILNTGNDENIGITINYQDRYEHEVVILASKADTKRDYGNRIVSEHVYYSAPMSFEVFSEKLREFNRSLKLMSKHNVVEAFCKKMGIVDVSRLSDEEKEARKAEIVARLKPLKKKEERLNKDAKLLSAKTLKAREAAQQAVSELPESIELAQLQKRMAELRKAIAVEEKTIFQPYHDAEKERNVVSSELYKLGKEIEQEESLLKKGLDSEDFYNLLHEVYSS
ncbi:hypothetical protein [Serratia sp. Se-RSBMAAmG]|uniref:hypothetical protein n=1 Tax=Serratia sp. Se-RSBMAAmG TaxID=3043305 RepID=UPI0024AF6DFC|nr:hypothetical protein [Serratia sp. Se-RSBMAAmG]MDI6976168.1 hypothetical protein [Serratia sp. Se-RSBMAAmG]